MTENPLDQLYTDCLLTSYIYTGIMPQKVEIHPFAKTKLRLPARIKKNISRYVLQGRCYDNALELAFLFPGVEYVEGEVVLSCGLPIIHAWNRLGDIHFDLTFEVHHPLELESAHYPIVSGTITSLKADGYTFDSAMDLYTQWLNRPETKAGREGSLFAKLVGRKEELESKMP